MTEKKRYTYKDLHYMGMNEMLELVNGLLDENEQLKSELKALRKKYNDFSDAVDKRLQEMDKRLFE